MTLFDEKQQLHIVIRNKGPSIGDSKRVYRNYSKYVQNVHVDNGGWPGICRDPDPGPANSRDRNSKSRDSRNRDKNLRDSPFFFVFI